ncbi:MAG: TIGR03960 family B12-binding radical SAM protein [Nitrospirota bacterium]
MNFSSFQKPSRYIDGEINALIRSAPVKIALAFPDVYEIGMSHLGLKILYKIINDLPYASAERVFSPWVDFESELRNTGTPLSSLESNTPLKDFDIVGFSLQYELSYTTVLNMLDLGGIPVRSEERKFSYRNRRLPFVVAGGPAAVNPAPMSAFIDAFLIGDGEEAIKEIVDTYYQWKAGGDGRRESLLKELSKLEGIYVPSVHKVNGKIKRRFIRSLEESPYPDRPIVPYSAIVHDRLNIEVARGCSMGCRFCQAGMIYRPVRERSPDKVLELTENSLKNTGYEEVAFTSLSAGDYSCLLPVVREFNARYGKNRIALSLPSLRVGSVNREVLKEIRAIRKTGFTIAPEAATSRLRDVINKDFSEEEYEKALMSLFEEGWHNLKLYFMIGLPTETEGDVEAIPQMAMKALRIAKQFTKRYVNISVGISPFVPKAHTPFQWFGQRPPDELKRKKDYLKNILSRKGFNIKGHDVEMSLLEAAFSRGDERLSCLIEKAWSLGCRLDGWTDLFDFGKWKSAMESAGIDIRDFAEKNFQFTDSMPWERVEIGLSKDFLWKEYNNGLSGDRTIDCRKVCQNCGIGCQENKMKSGDCVIEVVNSDRDKSLQFWSNVNAQLHKSRFTHAKIRVEFSKTGKLRYLSHLEIVTLIHRAIRRARFPLVYSKGFHPSPRISFGPPLGVGVAGLNEYFDMEVTPPFDLVGGINILNNVLPEGVRVNYMSAVPAYTESLNSFVVRYEYEIKNGNLAALEKFLSKKEFQVKREEHAVNLRTQVEKVIILNEETVRIFLVDQGDVKVRLGEILPLLFDALQEDLDVTRVALYGWRGEWVKPLSKFTKLTVNVK